MANKKLTEKQTSSIASLFVEDLIRYYKAGGDMKNLTAIKNGDNYSHWEYYFIMPSNNAILTFEVVDSFLV